MANLPLILVTASTEKKGVEFGDISQSLSEMYERSVIAAGGLPLICSSTTDPQLLAESVSHCDGILLTGGDDVTPALYSGKLPPRLAKTVGPTHGPRDYRELLLIAEVFRQRKPLLAICRGHQLLNVALGGTLVVDIAKQIPRSINHARSDKKGQIVHEVRLTADSLLARITGDQRLGVNSSHHQSVGRVAKPLLVTARAHDGVVEAFELKPAAAGWLPYLMAVQYHPERLAHRYPEHFRLFLSFTQACRKHRGKKL